MLLLRTLPASGDNMAIEQKHLDQAIALAKTYGATRLILFDSALRHPDQARDLDLACDGVAGWKLYELGARLEEESAGAASSLRLFLGASPPD